MRTKEESVARRKAYMKEYSAKYQKENPKRTRAYGKKYYDNHTDKIKAKKRNPVVTKKSSIKRNLKFYGLTINDYDKMYSNQNGMCAICQVHQSELKKRLYVDHCHTTKKVRGLLCHKCNTSLGGFGDNILMLQKAINYLSI